MLFTAIQFVSLLRMKVLDASSWRHGYQACVAKPLQQKNQFDYLRMPHTYLSDYVFCSYVYFML